MTTDLWQRARLYLFAQGRPLDRARFAYLLEDGSPRAVLDALVDGFQNDDGGFGRALEPDIRAQASSVIATVHGLEVLAELDLALARTAAARAIGYLHSQFWAQDLVWPMVSPAVEDAPHAPWWTYAETETTFGGFGINPTAAVAAALLHFADVVPLPAWMPHLLEAVVTRIEARVEQLDLNDMHTVLALHAEPHLPEDLRERLDRVLVQAIARAVAADEAAWSKYVLQPLDVAPAPDSWATAHLNPALLVRNLDYWEATQETDGSWPLPWRWDFVDAAAWAQAEQEWKGIQIVKRLQTVRAYGRA